ncbi:MAG: DctP family TRAP transporter solute-binding subunit [Nitriliruptorales bacterium]|nr:DctP family TRAP transporter solute-binding subunit [Nitriliruptorales bacterium]
MNNVPVPQQRRPLLALLSILLLVLAACGGGEGDDTGADDGADASGEVLELSFSVERGSEEVTGVDAVPDMMNIFANNLEEDLGDGVQIDRFFDRGDEFAQMELIRVGEVDVVPIGSDIVQLDEKFQIFDMPFLLPDRATAVAALDGAVGEQLKASLVETAGVRPLAFGEIGIRHITNNVRPIEQPEDLRGLTIRTPDSETRVLYFETLGAAPTPMSLDEVYLALDQGVLDGQENPLGNINGQSFYEVQDYLSLTGHVYTPVVLSINEERWQSLSAEHQEALQRAADAAAEESRAHGERNDEELLDVFQDHMEINEADTDAFREAAEPVWEEIASRVGEEFVQEVLDSIE